MPSFACDRVPAIRRSIRFSLVVSDKVRTIGVAQTAVIRRMLKLFNNLENRETVNDQGRGH